MVECSRTRSSPACNASSGRSGCKLTKVYSSLRKFVQPTFGTVAIANGMVPLRCTSTGVPDWNAHLPDAHSRVAAGAMPEKSALVRYCRMVAAHCGVMRLWKDGMPGCISGRSPQKGSQLPSPWCWFTAARARLRQTLAAAARCANTAAESPAAAPGASAHNTANAKIVGILEADTEAPRRWVTAASSRPQLCQRLTQSAGQQQQLLRMRTFALACDRSACSLQRQLQFHQLKLCNTARLPVPAD